jgi:atypical dual specificity phosphatase
VLQEVFGCVPNAMVADTPAGFFKFPRTHHLIDTGGSAMTRDDLLVDKKRKQLFIGPNAKLVSVQEKVDGANLGISIDKDYNIILQNRSHYVTSATGMIFCVDLIYLLICVGGPR